MSATPDSTSADPQQVIAELQQQLAIRTAERNEALAERDEALEQQTATAEVLQVINTSPGELGPVFDAILDKDTRLCEATCGQLATYDGEFFRFVAAHGDAGFTEEQCVRGLLPPSVGTTWPRMVDGESVVHIADVRDTDLYRLGHEGARRLVDDGGGRSLLAIALRKEDILLGTLAVYRKQIALLRNFAAQAVIAIENARLITETREALEQQTATAEVLQVINSSPGDVAPVFEAILEKAHNLCGIALGELELYEDGKVRAVAMRGVSGPFAALLREPFVPPPQSPPARLLAGEPIVQITDLTELAREQPDDPRAQAGARYGLRTVLFVPLRKDDALCGYITAYRKEVRPFSEKEIALLQNFAAQAVIAIDNARLITETREALEQQTATAQVLQVINSSPGDLTPVFEAILEKAHSLCGIAFGSLQLNEGGKFRAVAVRGAPDSLAELLRQPIDPLPGAPPARLLGGERIVQVADYMAAYAEQQPSHPRAQATAEHGWRTALYVPLRRDVGDAELLGYITAFRREVRLFSDKEIALLQNFAAQAVIAIENARLITETREALEQQTATAEILQIINSSPGDLAPVFDAILEKSMRLCGAAFGLMIINDGDKVPIVAARGVPAAFAAFRRKYPVLLIKGPFFSRLSDGEDFVHTIDLRKHRRNSGLRVCIG